MLLQIPDVLNAEQVRHCRTMLDSASWVDGKITAGYQSAKAKDNSQLQENSPAARELGDLIIDALQKNLLFMSAALPEKIYPPLFNRYTGGQSFGTHIDNAIRPVTGTPHRVRTDISATLFLCSPEEYEGGELVVEDTYGVHSVKLSAGHMVLYPGSSLHHVKPVTKGARIASFFWIQSMVREDSQRTLLFDLDMAIHRIGQELPNNPVSIQLTGVYHNLLRRWANV